MNYYYIEECPCAYHSGTYFLSQINFIQVAYKFPIKKEKISQLKEVEGHILHILQTAGFVTGREKRMQKSN
ncbi:MAG: hypothetical protein QHH17_02425 [Candidatus Bathyarchaeota archaeon]|nr:hypothetical protein [Candidatus Bathyarchaeota archaeon]